MLNIFKRKTTVITIPIDNAQSVTQLDDTFRIEWTSIKHSFSDYGKHIFNVKVFIHEKDAIEFKKQLEESAKFINSDIWTKIIKND